MGTQRRRGTFLVNAWPALSAAILLLIVVAVARVHRRSATRTVAAQSKGDFGLLVFARKAGRIEMLDRFNRAVRPGDEVRFVLTGTPEGHAYVLVGSVDGSGRPNVYFPFEGTKSVPLPGPGRWEVPGSIELDDTLGPERVFVFFSPQPLEVTEVREALSTLGRRGANAIRDAQAVDVPRTTQRSFLMMKEAKITR